MSVCVVCGSYLLLSLSSPSLCFSFYGSPLLSCSSSILFFVPFVPDPCPPPLLVASVLTATPTTHLPSSRGIRRKFRRPPLFSSVTGFLRMSLSVGRLEKPFPLRSFCSRLAFPCHLAQHCALPPPHFLSLFYISFPIFFISATVVLNVTPRFSIATLAVHVLCTPTFLSANVLATHLNSIIVVPLSAYLPSPPCMPCVPFALVASVFFLLPFCSNFVSGHPALHLCAS